MTNEEMAEAGIVACAYRFESDREGAIRVEWRGDDRWAIIRGSACYNALGEWEYEPMASNRTEEFIARCRYPLDEALRRALVAIRESP
jgi:hypothetical protein